MLFQSDVPKSIKKGDLNKIYFQCNRGRTFRSQVKGNKRKRNRCTRRIDCPFSMVLSYSKSFDSWSLKIREASHNHDTAFLIEVR